MHTHKIIHTTHTHIHTHLQDEFNSAYNYPNFLLQQRVADVMLNVSE